MKLYHGTSRAALSQILKHGIKPRSESSKGNWEKAPSHAHRVYLTNSYALYFAVAAMSDDDKEAIVLEIDTDKLDLDLMLPDEDFISQALFHNKQNEGKSLVELNASINVLAYQHEWEKSLKGLGNVAYLGSVPTEAITRYVRVKLSPLLASWSLEPTISIYNYLFVGENYRALMGWLFGGPPPSTATVQEITRQVESVEHTPEDAEWLKSVFYQYSEKEHGDLWAFANESIQNYFKEWEAQRKNVEIIEVVK